METYKPAYAIKLSAKNFGFEDSKKTVPLYARILYLKLKRITQSVTLTFTGWALFFSQNSLRRKIGLSVLLPAG